MPRAIPAPAKIPGQPGVVQGPGRLPPFPSEQFTSPPTYSSEEFKYRSQVAQFEREVSGFNTRIKDLQDRIATAKSNGVMWLVPQLQAELEENQRGLGKARNSLSEVQNKYWEITGQYDKLLAGSDRDAFMAVNALFKNYGLESLAGKIFEYVKGGFSPDTISILLQDSPEYKQRFIGNEARKKAGLPVLSAAEYLATESAYRQVMESAGLPKGFYDQNTDFADFIGKNVSPTEVQNRVNLAVQATSLAPPEYRDALKAMGIAEGDMVAYWLDEKKALPILTKAAATAQIGAQALSQGLKFDVGYSEALAQRGVSAEQAAQGYSAIAAELENLNTLGSIYGERWNQRLSEEAMFQGNAQALATKRRLASQERGQFGGSAGGARGGLAQRGGQR